MAVAIEVEWSGKAFWTREVIFNEEALAAAMNAINSMCAACPVEEFCQPKIERAGLRDRRVKVVGTQNYINGDECRIRINHSIVV